MKITGNILGDMVGQLGKKIVAFQWKGIDCFRSYVVPANPNTLEQQAQRTLFAGVVALAVMFLDAIINVYWNKFAVKMTSFNAFIKYNLKSMTSSTDFDKIIMTKGALHIGAISSCGAVSANVVIEFDPSLSGSGKADDNVMAAVFDEDTFSLYLAAAAVERSTGTITVPVYQGFSAAKCHAYLWAYRDLGTPTEDVSNSLYSAVTPE